MILSTRNIKTDSSRVLGDMMSRLMAMNIFEYLPQPVQYQLLNRRFYTGILPRGLNIFNDYSTNLARATDL